MFVSHFENKLKEAANAKSSGTQLFKAQRYPQAIQDYEKALSLVQPHLYYGASVAQLLRSGQLRMTLTFNIGLCHFNNKSWEPAQQRFSEAIALNPQYWKAICKRALTRYEREDYEGAMSDIKHIYELDTSNRQFTEAYAKIERKYNEFMAIKAEKDTKSNEKVKKAAPAPKKPEEKKEIPKGEDNKGKKWWIFAIIAIAGAGLYQILKKERK